MLQEINVSKDNLISQAQSVLDFVYTGELDPETAERILSCMQKTCDLTERTELEQRINDLEEKLNNAKNEEARDKIIGLEKEVSNRGPQKVSLFDDRYPPDPKNGDYFTCFRNGLRNMKGKTSEEWADYMEIELLKVNMRTSRTELLYIYQEYYRKMDRGI